MKRYIFITMAMLFSLVSFTYANTPCCNNKITCSKCAHGCGKPQCLDTCSKSCKASGECTKTCKN
jgi:hypothetical protein